MKKNLFILLLVGLGAGNLYGTKNQFVGQGGIPTPIMNQNPQPNPDVPNPDVFDTRDMDNALLREILKLHSDDLKKTRRNNQRNKAPQGAGQLKPRRQLFKDD